MSFPVQAAKNELHGLTRWRAMRVVELAAEGPPDEVSGSLLLGLGSRESDLRNITGGGTFVDGQWVPDGRDRGCWQISSVWHSAWLAGVPGCKEGTWIEEWDESSGGALPAGRVPGLTRACRFVIGLLGTNAAVAERGGIPEEDWKAVAVAGYNCGIGGAVKAYKAGDVDRYTTGGNYSRDVLDRQRAFREALRELKWT